MKINKYFPFAFVYFFVNSLALPFGLTYTAILSHFTCKLHGGIYILPGLLYFLKDMRQPRKNIQEITDYKFPVLPDCNSSPFYFLRPAFVDATYNNKWRRKYQQVKIIYLRSFLLCCFVYTCVFFLFPATCLTSK